MREMIQELTGENEALVERISGLEARPQPQQHPPPDITGHGHGHNPPDVASMSANNNPDIMFVSGAGANPDIMDLGGQAQGGWGWGDDAVEEAANWFDQQVTIIISVLLYYFPKHDTCLLIALCLS